MALCNAIQIAIARGQHDRTNMLLKEMPSSMRGADEAPRRKIMIDARYEDLKRTLEVRREELQRNLGVKLADVRANNGRDGGRRHTLDAAEASESDLQQDVSVSLTKMAAQVVSRVDEALARLASGVYGVCAECNTEIAMKRLTALPFAVRCRDCEELREVDATRSRRLSAGTQRLVLPG